MIYEDGIELKKLIGITHEDIKPIYDEKFNITKDVAIVFQFAVNSFQRQGLVNLKYIADHGGSPFQKLKQTPHIFINGYSSRLLYQLGAMCPAIYVRDEKIDKDTSKLAVTAVTAAIDTTLGAGLELRAISETIKKEGGNVPQGRQFATTTGLIMAPFMVRNYLAWFGYNMEEKDWKKRAMWGGLLNTVAGIPDSIGNAVIKESFTINNAEDVLNAYAKVCQELEFKTIARAAPYRGVGGALAAVILSKESRQIIAQGINHFVNMLTSDAAVETPNSFTTNPLSTIVSEKTNVCERAK